MQLTVCTSRRYLVVTECVRLAAGCIPTVNAVVLAEIGGVHVPDHDHGPVAVAVAVAVADSRSCRHSSQLLPLFESLFMSVHADVDVTVVECP